jgi:ribonuclease P protein component
VKREGRRAKTAHFGVNYAPNDLNYHRFGTVVQKRFWSSIQRNRIKRRLREWFRLHKQQITPPAKDIVIIARPGAEQLSSNDVAAELATIFLK